RNSCPPVSAAVGCTPRQRAWCLTMNPPPQSAIRRRPDRSPLLILSTCSSDLCGGRSVGMAIRQHHRRSGQDFLGAVPVGRRATIFAWRKARPNHISIVTSAPHTESSGRGGIVAWQSSAYVLSASIGGSDISSPPRG